MNEQANIEYNIKCLEERRRDLERYRKKYPLQMAWIEIELARALEAKELYGSR